MLLTFPGRFKPCKGKPIRFRLLPKRLFCSGFSAVHLWQPFFIANLKYHLFDYLLH